MREEETITETDDVETEKTDEMEQTKTSVETEIQGERKVDVVQI